ncbi:hypothetical protein DL769_010788 [Monosporascus sp. CRB-8-3]|nr:hypothetical protein DL769_010788 [Monosporascus sp. CRB-8-3]
MGCLLYHGSGFSRRREQADAPRPRLQMQGYPSGGRNLVRSCPRSEKLDQVLNEKLVELQATDTDAKRPPIAGLIVSIYQPSDIGTVKRDHVYWIGLPVMVLGLGIAAIPCGISGDWGALLITAVGIALALTTELLPQWRKEKWACWDKAMHNYILTRGNGSRHAIVIQGEGRGYYLEDLASG